MRGGFFQRRQRFPAKAKRLIEPQEDRIACRPRLEAPSQRLAINPVKLTDPAKAKPLEQGLCVFRQAQRADGKLSKASGFFSIGEDVSRPVARESAGRSRRTGKAEPVRDGILLKQGNHSSHHGFLTAMKMVAACGLNHQPVIAINGDDRGETHHPVANPLQRGAVSLPVDILMQEVGAAGAGVGKAKACRYAKCARRSVGRRNAQAMTAILDEDEGFAGRFNRFFAGAYPG